MSDRENNSLLKTASVALCAGVVGSLLTYAATHRLTNTGVTPEPAATTATGVDSAGTAHDQSALAMPAAPDATEPTPAEVQQAIVDADAERSQLSESILLLTRKVETLEAQLFALDSNSSVQAQSDLSGADGSEALGDTSPLASPETPPGNRFNTRDSAEQRTKNLIAAGVDEQTARDLQSRRDQYQLARLELFDQAAREGWSESEELDQKLEVLDEDRVDLREELGDDAYDRYLYESGSTNRVGVASVITGSAADSAGLQAGDMILSYAGTRVFQVREIQAATRGGQRGEYVQIVFTRDAQTSSTDIPRGPLGVTLSTTREAP